MKIPRTSERSWSMPDGATFRPCPARRCVEGSIMAARLAPNTYCTGRGDSEATGGGTDGRCAVV